MKEHRVEGALHLDKPKKIAIISARFNAFIVDSLQKAAVETLLRSGCTEQDITIMAVPGAYEIPFAAQTILANPEYDAAIALGCVIRGATSHYEYVAANCYSSCQQVSLKFNKPIAMGVLTTDTIEQAIERAGTKAGNKGFDAAQVIVEMLNLVQRLAK